MSCTMFFEGWKNGNDRNGLEIWQDFSEISSPEAEKSLEHVFAFA